MNSVVTGPMPATHRGNVKSRASLPYKQALGLSVVLVIATAAIYFPVIHHPFANLDDQGYVYENLHVQEGLTWSTIGWAFRTFDDSNWHPLTWLSHAADCQMFGIEPAGHHAMNVAWHILDAVLLFWILLQATGYLGRSWMVAALFALHPINVESVAWVAERKTLVSTLFLLLALGAYRWYATRPGIGRYAAVAGLFALGLMAKPQIIMLPLALLLWDYWPLERIAVRSSLFAFRQNVSGDVSGERRRAKSEGRTSEKQTSDWRWLLLEKLPLFALCAASALLTMLAQRVGRPQHWPYSWKVRIGNSIVAYVRYIKKAIWPSKLAILYLHPGSSLKLWLVAVSALVLLAVTAFVIVRYRQRYLLVGWFWFLVMLVPVIGIVQVGRQALADRYAYQSFIGLFIMICWGVADWAQQRHLSKALVGSVSIAALIALTIVTYRQIGYWRDNLALWTRGAAVTSNNWVAEDMIGGILLNTGHREEAMPHYRRALAWNPTDAGSNLSVAIHEQQHGDLQDAIRHYRKSLIEMDDALERAKVYQNMAVAYRDMGDIDQSLDYLRAAARLRKPAGK